MYGEVHYRSKKYKIVEKSDEQRVTEYGGYIETIENPNEELQLKAVKQYGGFIRFIKQPTEKVQIEAVQQYPPYIKHINDPSIAVQLMAVMYDGFLIKSIKNPSQSVQMEATRQSLDVIDHIKEPVESLQLLYVDKLASKLQRFYLTDKAQLAMVKNNLDNYNYIKNPIMSLKSMMSCNTMDIVDSNEDGINNSLMHSIKYKLYCLLRPSEEAVDTALSKVDMDMDLTVDTTVDTIIRALHRLILLFPKLFSIDTRIRYIHAVKASNYILYIKKGLDILKMPSDISDLHYDLDKLLLITIFIDSDCLKEVRPLPDKVATEVVSKDGSLIRYMTLPSIALQFLAVSQDGNNIQYIDNPNYMVMEQAANVKSEPSTQLQNIVYDDSRNPNEDMERIESEPSIIIHNIIYDDK